MLIFQLKNNILILTYPICNANLRIDINRISHLLVFENLRPDSNVRIIGFAFLFDTAHNQELIISGQSVAINSTQCLFPQLSCIDQQSSRVRCRSAVRSPSAVARTAWRDLLHLLRSPLCRTWCTHNQVGGQLHQFASPPSATRTGWLVLLIICILRPIKDKIDFAFRERNTLCIKSSVQFTKS